MKIRPLSIFPSIVATFLAFNSAIQGALAPVHIMQPDYPDELISKGFEGDATLKVTVTTEGTVGKCEVIFSDHELLGIAAKEAVQQWIFTPHEVGGQPVEKEVQIPFKFRLSEQQRAALKLKKLNALFGREVFKPLDPSIEIIVAEDLSENPRPTIPIIPIYPQELRGSGKKGKVVLKFYLDGEGKVINPSVLSSSDPAFEPNALASLIRGEYEQQRWGEQPIYVEMQCSVEFLEPAKEERKIEAEKEENSK